MQYILARFGNFFPRYWIQHLSQWGRNGICSNCVRNDLRVRAAVSWPWRRPRLRPYLNASPQRRGNGTTMQTFPGSLKLSIVCYPDITHKKENLVVYFTPHMPAAWERRSVLTAIFGWNASLSSGPSLHATVKTFVNYARASNFPSPLIYVNEEDKHIQWKTSR